MVKDTSLTVTDQPNLASSALAYAERGWYVVPLHTPTPKGCSCRSRTCRRPGKHPLGYLVGNGASQASRYPSQIDRWWKRRSDANVGVVCGPSGLVVLDVDPRNGGLESLQSLQERHGDLPTTLTARTGGQGGEGRHLVYADPDLTIRGSKGDGGDALYPGIEILARGNYFVAAPSLHHSGNRYEWLDPEATVAPAPAWMAEGLR